jgi:hypothetical protein
MSTFALLAAVVLLGGASAKAAPLVLLDNRGWEMVSPVEKNGGEVQGFGGNFGGDVLQAAGDGESATFSSASSFGGDALGAPVASQYVARRTPGGWLSEDVTPPTFAGAYGEDPAGVPYRVFSPDLARALMLEGQGCAEQPGCPRGYSLRQSAGGVIALSPEEPDLRLAGASPDLRHVILSTCAALTPDAREALNGKGECEPGADNLYEWGEGELRVINVLPGETESTPNARLASPLDAVSEDGSRIYWELGGTLYLYEAGSSVHLDESEGTAEFETASPDGGTAYFIRDEHLYSYAAASGKSTYYFLSPFSQGGGFGGLIGLLAASANATYIYYVGGDGALYVRHEGNDTRIGDAVDASDYPPATATVRLSADGTRLLFLSSAPLTGYDNTDRDTGEPDSEVFLYDAAANGGAGQLTCLSCRRDNARPIGPSSILGTVANGAGPDGTRIYRPRVLTDGARRDFFDSRDALVGQDTNNDRDIYEWEEQGTGSCTAAGGCVDLISSGRSEDGASFVDASEDGRDAFFLTDGSLVPGDPGAVDLYDARAGGGFPVPPKPIPCEGDACQPLPSPPEDPSPGTQLVTEGNPPVRFVKKPGGKKHKPKAEKHGHKKGKRRRGRR